MKLCQTKIIKSKNKKKVPFSFWKNEYGKRIFGRKKDKREQETLIFTELKRRKLKTNESKKHVLITNKVYLSTHKENS